MVVVGGVVVVVVDRVGDVDDCFPPLLVATLGSFAS